MVQKRLRHEERRSQIIEVSMDLFASRGFKATTTRAIAKAVGVSEAIIFRHFATKNDLYDAIITHTIQKRQALWEQEQVDTEGADDLEMLLRNYAYAYIRRNRQDPTFIRLMMYSALQEHKFREHFFEIYRSPHIMAIRKSIEDGIAEGIYRQVNPHLTARSFLWILQQYSVNRFIARSQAVPLSSDEEIVENLVSIFMNGLKCIPAQAGQPVQEASRHE